MILKLEDVVTCYEKSKVLQGVSMVVEKGEVVALLGRNGAGKTTTMRSIMGLAPPQAGSIEFDGLKIIGKPPYDIARLGISYVPEDRRIFPDLSVEENLLLAERLTPKGHEKVWTLKRVYELFPVLYDFRKRKGALLSGGQQKMLALARSLMKQPKLLLLDECTEGLAPLIVREFLRVLNEVRRAGTTILMADQNFRFARSLADRGYVIDKGLINYTGPMEDICSNEEIVRKYLTV